METQKFEKWKLENLKKKIEKKTNTKSSLVGGSCVQVCLLSNIFINIFSTDTDMTQKLLVAFLENTGQAERAYRITHEIPEDDPSEMPVGFAD